MSAAAPDSRKEAAQGLHGGAGSSAPARAEGWRVRPARQEDAAAVAAAVHELLIELDGASCSVSEMERVARALIADPEAGAVLVADTGEEIVGVLAASWQIAIHALGAYATIQDLWVRSDWRGRSIGAALVSALVALARSRGMTRIEVGLPRESFSGFQATEAFYLGNDFQPNGPRLRRLLS
jgi:GNAT superfamily N-acetyltransferase